MVSELATRLPDLPRWVETRGMLLSGRCDLIVPPEPGAADAVVRGTDFGLFCVSGDPPLEALPAALARHGGRAVLCAGGRSEELSTILSGWTRSRAVIHALAGEEPSGPRVGQAGVRVAMLSGRDAGALSHVPDRLREELSTALGCSHVAAAFVEDLPVAFCYASYETETLWDLSIDTLEGYRRRGLARASSEFLIGHMARHGKRPVWGALDSNAPSIRMAASLGFVPVDTLTVFAPPEAA